VLKRLEFVGSTHKVEGMGIWGGKAEKLEKRECKKKMEEESKPAPFSNGAKGFGTHFLPSD